MIVHEPPEPPGLLGRLLCALGLHKWEPLPASNVGRLQRAAGFRRQCRRCPRID